MIAIRVAVGILLVLAIVDLKQRGRAATRWREYAFLLLCVAVAIAYGIANDQITSRISWEYFYYGKGLAPILGPKIPPDRMALHHQALRIGAEATWAAGLLAGVALLLANNPRTDLPQLSWWKLAGRLPSFVAIAAATGVLLGAIGSQGWLNWIDQDFAGLFKSNLWRPARFMTVFGIHLGGYLGGLLGIAYNVVRITKLRKAAAPQGAT
jgi:hypothetical protein